MAIPDSEQEAGAKVYFAVKQSAVGYSVYNLISGYNHNQQTLMQTMSVHKINLAGHSTIYDAIACILSHSVLHNKQSSEKSDQ